MATINTALKMYDGITPALKSMDNAMRIILSSFEDMKNASQKSIDTSNIQTAREELNKASANIRLVEKNLEQAKDKQDGLKALTELTASAMGKLKAAALGVVGAIDFNKVFDLSDTLVQNKARLNSMNDGLQSTEELQNKIFASAQRTRAPYNDVFATVEKLGTIAGNSFGSNEEIIAFAELMNKQFALGGASVQEQAAAMDQLTQAMAAGQLQGDEFRTMLENTPVLAQYIAKELGVGTGELRDMASAGKITSDIIRNAIFGSAEDINSKFEEMPKTFKQVWTIFKNNAVSAFQPVLIKLNEMLNSEGIQSFIALVTSGLQTVAGVAMVVLEAIESIATFFSENWSTIESVIWGIITAFGAYLVILGVIKTAEMVIAAIKIISAIASYIHAAATKTQASATAAATAAQYGLNTALMACPIFWIILAIILLIAIFFAVIEAINHFTGSSLSAVGMVAGAFAWAGALIGNIFIGLWNKILNMVKIFYNTFKAVAEFFANVFKDPIGSILRLFVAMGTIVLDIIIAIAEAVDTVLGTNLAGGVEKFKNDMLAWADDKVGEAEIQLPDLNTDGLKLDRLDMGAAYDAGFEFGSNLDLGLPEFDMPEFDSYDFDGGGGGGGAGAGATAANTGSTADNTQDMANSMDATVEELKYLRDLAEQEAINRFTTAEIRIDMNNNNTISSEMDIDGVVDVLEEKLQEAMEAAAEGVPA